MTIAVALFAAAVCGRADEPAQLRVLIQQLGSLRAVEREVAQRRLFENDRAIPYLRDGSLRNPDAEIRAQCALVLDRRKEALRDDMLCYLKELSRRGEFGRAVCVAVAWRETLRVKLADFEMVAAKNLCARVEEKTKRATAIPKLPERYRLVTGPKDPIALWGVGRGNYLVAGRRLQTTVLYSSWLLLSDSVDECAYISDSVLFTGGPAGLSAKSSIVFVDGDLTIGYSTDSLIVCTGDISPNDFHNCTVIAGGRIRESSDLKYSKNSLLRSNEKELAEMLRPWKAEELGVEPVVRDGRVHVGKIAPKSPMAQAGVLTNDVLVSLDGEKIATPAEAVKLLRQKSAEFLPFLVHVKRGDRELELFVPWKLPARSQK